MCDKNVSDFVLRCLGLRFWRTFCCVGSLAFPSFVAVRCRPAVFPRPLCLQEWLSTSVSCVHAGFPPPAFNVSFSSQQFDCNVPMCSLLCINVKSCVGCTELLESWLISFINLGKFWTVISMDVHMCLFAVFTPPLPGLQWCLYVRPWPMLLILFLPFLVSLCFWTFPVDWPSGSWLLSPTET